ncbi:MAG: chromosome segregation protein SMC [Clostridia bacterium]
MKFKKMEIYGFKSFADKLEIKFESGVTGIVGPNGCGKSNVADAIRWVLGEQSAKSLRGSSMMDVIFNGTEQRKSQSFCEVSLFFDNTTKIFPVEYDEVVLTRKLYRSGDSEYLINKVQSRLKDIIDLLRDSGLGKESYSIIGQGRIDEILSAKPEDRRMVFEEAAGISKFKSRKVDAERKLERTRDNLMRINDIIFELEKQITPLTKQSENAKKYLELKEILKTLEVNIYIHQYDTASSAKGEISVRIDGLTEELELKQKEFEKVLAEYNQSVINLSEVDKRIEELRDELLSLTVGLEKHAGEVKLFEEKCLNMKQINEKTAIDITSEQEEKANLQENYKIKNDAKNLRETILIELKRNAENINSSYLEIVDRLTESELLSENSGNDIIEAVDKLTNVKVDFTSLNFEKTAKYELKSEKTAQKSAIIANLLKLNSDLSEEKRVIEKVIKDKELSIQLLSEQELKLTEINYSIQDNNNKIEENNAKYHSAESRNKLLNEMLLNDEGFAFSVRKILQDSKINASLGGAVVGVVAKLMSVPEKFETAIEMALGASVQNIVTKSDDDAKIIVEYLKKNNYGRATFLPISSLKPRYLPKEFEKALEGEGVFGVATNLIKFDESLKNIFEGLLGSTVIVCDIEHAVSLAKITRYGFKIVTLDGDVINPQGSISGGSKKVEVSSLIGREREIELLKKDIATCLKKSAILTNEKESLLNSQKELSDIIKKEQENCNSINVQYVKLSENIRRISEELNENETEKNKLEREISALTIRIEFIEEQIVKTQKIEDEISFERQSASTTKKASYDSFSELKKKREFYYNELTELKIKIATTESELSSLNDEIVRLDERIDDISLKLQTNKLLFAQNETNIKSLEQTLKSVYAASKTDKNMQSLQAVRDKLSSQDTFKSEIQKVMNKSDEMKMLASYDIQRISDKKLKEEMQLAKIDTDIEAMQERIFEEYGLTYNSAIKLKIDNFNNSESLIEAGKIRKHINALGFVNVQAIEELKTVTERYNDLASQRDDLASAEADLNKIITELTTQMESKFKEKFEQINTNFGIVFKELFGGGSAKLVLQDDATLLEAGIDIIAEPPGKKLQSITLMSGGERALTAIAILFAILRLRPMPFCVLDEIEAALDDANVERYAKYLKRFSESTQFIVITHRKPTMELADCLYGVTMEEKGVSKIMSVKLSDAVKNVEVK